MESRKVTFTRITDRFGEVVANLATPSSNGSEQADVEIDFDSLPFTPAPEQLGEWRTLIKEIRAEKDLPTQKLLAGILLFHMQASVAHPLAPQTLAQDATTLEQRLAEIAENQTRNPRSAESPEVTVREGFPPTMPASRNAVGDKKPKEFDPSKAKIVVGESSVATAEGIDLTVPNPTTDPLAETTSPTSGLGTANSQRPTPETPTYQ